MAHGRAIGASFDQPPTCRGFLPVERATFSFYYTQYLRNWSGSAAGLVGHIRPVVRLFAPVLRRATEVPIGLGWENLGFVDFR